MKLKVKDANTLEEGIVTDARWTLTGFLLTMAVYYPGLDEVIRYRKTPDRLFPEERPLDDLRLVTKDPLLEEDAQENQKKETDS